MMAKPTNIDPDLAGDSEFRARFRREVAVLTRVRGMCTVPVIEADTESVSRPFLVTEFADGPSLAEYVASHGPLDADMLYGLATGLAEALAAIHAAASALQAALNRVGSKLALKGFPTVSYYTTSWAH